MFALVESGSITKMLSGNRGITIGSIQYPRDIFSKWTEVIKLQKCGYVRNQFGKRLIFGLFVQRR